MADVAFNEHNMTEFEEEKNSESGKTQPLEYIEVEVDISCVKQELIDESTYAPDEFNLSWTQKRIRRKKKLISKSNTKKSRIDNRGTTGVLQKAKDSKRRAMCAPSQFLTYTCDMCHKSYKKKDILRAHIIRLHGSGSYKCSKCDRNFKCEQYLLRHTASVHCDEYYKCETCGEVFKSRSHLYQHVRQVHSSITHKCSACHCVFKMKQTLQQHIISAHGIMIRHDCVICKKVFKSKKHLYSHISIFHSETAGGLQKYKCNHCNKVYNHQPSLSRHMKKNKCSHVEPPISVGSVNFKDEQSEAKGVKEQPCNRALKLFHQMQLKYERYKEALLRGNLKEQAGSELALKVQNLLDAQNSPHIQNIRNSPDIQKVENMDNLQNGSSEKTPKSHLLMKEKMLAEDWSASFNLDTSIEKRGYSIDDSEVRSKIQPFPCNYDLKTYKQNYIMINHESGIIGTDSYKCSGCNRDFKCKQYLLRHISIIHGYQRNKCEHCGKIFRSIISLHRHVREVHSLVRHECPICNNVFKRNPDLQRHITYAHGNEKHECHVCKKIFKAKLLLQKHVRTVHGSFDNKPKFKCNICLREFKAKLYLRRHQIQTKCSRFKVDSLPAVNISTFSVSNLNLSAIDGLTRSDSLSRNISSSCNEVSAIDILTAGLSSGDLLTNKMTAVNCSDITNSIQPFNVTVVQ